MATADIVERLANIDVRATREFSKTVPQWAKDNGRIDWRVRNSDNMKKMKTHTINDIYQS